MTQPTDLLNHLHQPSTTYKSNRPLVRGAEVTTEACGKCGRNNNVAERTEKANGGSPTCWNCEAALTSIAPVLLCSYCRGTVAVTECVAQEHWEKRLKTHHLNENRAFRPLMENVDKEQVDRLVPLSVQDADKIVVGPVVLPSDPDLREVFAMESLGVRYQHEPKRFWPNPQAPFGTTYDKSGRMGRVYGQAMPCE